MQKIIIHIFFLSSFLINFFPHHFFPHLHQFLPSSTLFSLFINGMKTCMWINHLMINPEKFFPSLHLDGKDVVCDSSWWERRLEREKKRKRDWNRGEKKRGDLNDVYMSLFSLLSFLIITIIIFGSFFLWPSSSFSSLLSFLPLHFSHSSLFLSLDFLIIFSSSYPLAQMGF